MPSIDQLPQMLATALPVAAVMVIVGALTLGALTAADAALIGFRVARTEHRTRREAARRSAEIAAADQRARAADAQAWRTSGRLRPIPNTSDLRWPTRVGEVERGLLDLGDGHLYEVAAVMSHDSKGVQA